MSREAQLEAVKQRVLAGDGESSAEWRDAAWNARDGLPADLAAFAQQLRVRADGITDADVEALRQKYADDVIFEVMVAASLGRGESLLRRGLSVLEDD